MKFADLLNLLPAQVAPASGLELDDDLCEFQVSLLLQLGKHSCSEEHLGVTDPVGCRVQV